MAWSMLSTELQIMILEEILLPSDVVTIPHGSYARFYQRTVLPAKSLNVLRVSRSLHSLGLSIFQRNVFSLIETGDYEVLLSGSRFDAEDECAIMSWQDQGRNVRNLRYLKPELRTMPAPPPLIAKICHEKSENTEEWVLEICLGTRFLACFLHGHLRYAIAARSRPSKVRIRISECRMFIMGTTFTNSVMEFVRALVPPSTVFEIEREGVSTKRGETVQDTCEQGFRNLQHLLAERNKQVLLARPLQGLSWTTTDRQSSRNTIG